MNPSDKALDILREYWGYTAFRGSQQAVIAEVMAGRDALALMPTGGGKTLCYQVPALALGGICLVVSPLIALMEDQLATLKKRGIKAMGLYGRLPEVELIRKLDNAVYGNYRFLYLSPERLQQELVLQHLERMEISLIAIDEAHCISQWGYDFRPAYRECGKLRELFPGVPMLALTATATRDVERDIIAQLGLAGTAVFRDPVRRENLAYQVQLTEDKYYRLKAQLGAAAGSSIVYVRTRRATKALASYLEQQEIGAAAYHGGMDPESKSRVLANWKSGAVPVVVATNAFGMGVDKADVRSVIHFEIPETIEHYYQEAGRAGRDGQPATALLLATEADLESGPAYFLDNLPDVNDLIRVYARLCSYFQVAYGEMPELPLPFRFESFCEAYGLPASRTYNALEVLDRQGVIALRQVVRSSVKLQFVCSRDILWNYLETYPASRKPVQALLRTYGGVFDFETPVNTLLLARRLSMPESKLIEALRQLEKDGLIELFVHQGDLEIHFLKPREDARTIHAFGREIADRNALRRRKVHEMLAFVQNNTQCRQLQLATYFGEVAAGKCGKCDACTPPGTRPGEGLRLRILSCLSDGPKTSRQLSAAGCEPEPSLLHCLQNMLEEGRLRIGPRNEYILNTL